MAIKTERNLPVKKAEESLDQATTKASPSERVHDLLRKSVETNQLSPEDTWAQLNTSFHPKNIVDLEKGQINKSVHEAYTFINDTGIGNRNLPDYSFKASAEPSALAGYHAVEKAMADIKYPALVSTVGMAIAKGRDPLMSALVADTERTDQVLESPLNKSQLAQLAQSFEQVKKFVTQELVKKDIQLSNSVLLRRNGIRSEQEIAAAAA